jgi:hypothetical protein
LLFLLGVHDIGPSALASREGVSDNDKMLFNCLEHVSYAKVFTWFTILGELFVPFFSGAALEEGLDIREGCGGSAMLVHCRVGGNQRTAAHRAYCTQKVAEVERCERALTSDYADLRRDFSDLQTVHAPIVKEKADLEKTERNKAQ